MMTTEEWNDKTTGSDDGRADLSSPLGAVAMRDAAIAEIDCGGCYGKCVDPANCRLDDVAAIRAIPLPTHAALLAAALKLPEVAAMAEALTALIERYDEVVTTPDCSCSQDDHAVMNARRARAALEVKP